MNRMQRTAGMLADSPYIFLLGVVVLFVAAIVAPRIDDRFDVVKVRTIGEPVFVGQRELGFTLEACRVRSSPRYAAGRGITFTVQGPGDVPPSSVRVADVDAGATAGSGGANLRSGDCRVYRYVATLGELVQEGDIITGTAHYISALGWWGLSDDYGEIRVPAFPRKLKEFQERIIQRELLEQGVIVEDFLKTE